MCSIKIPQTHMHFEVIKNFIPDLLRQLDMELKPYRKWHLKSGAKSLKIRKWKPECVCCICAKYLQHVGFINIY